MSIGRNYWLEAKKLVARFGGKRYSNNDDCVADVMEGLFRAEQTHNPEKGSINTWSYWHARAKFLRFLEKENKRKKMFVPIVDNIVKKDDIQTFWEKEEINDILDRLNDRESFVIKSYFLEEKNLRQIGKEINLSHERVRQIRDKAIERLQRVLEK